MAAVMPSGRRLQQASQCDDTQRLATLAIEGRIPGVIVKAPR
jgi:hypothetical protein